MNPISKGRVRLNLLTMVLNAENLYHPFQDSSFGIFTRDEYLLENTKGQLIEDINLFYQPVQIPLVAIIFLIVKLLVLIAGEFLQFKVYQLITKERGILKDVGRLVVVTQMIFWPFWVSFASSTDFIHPMNQVVGQWFCDFGYIVFYFLGNIIIFHSFIVALMRYFFIVHETKVNDYGKEKVESIFLILSICFPLIVVTWKGLEGADLNAMSFINKCYGKHHRVFLVETSTLDVVKRNFCGLETYEIEDSFSNVVAISSQFSCIVVESIMIIIGLNIVEGFIYIRIFVHINRYIQGWFWYTYL